MKHPKDGRAMPGPLLVRSAASRLAMKEKCEKQAKDLESIAQLVEGMIAKFKKEEERQFYCEVVRNYRGVARDLFRNAALVEQVALNIDGGGVAPIRVLVVDDYVPWRLFVSSALQSRPEFVIVDEVSDGLEAVQKAQELQPDLILMDVGLPTLNGIEVTRRIRRISPTMKILFVSQESSHDVMREALSTGAQGYIVKANATHLLTAMDAVLSA